MRRASGNSWGGSEIGVSRKTFQEGQVVEVDLGLKLQNQDRPFLCNQSDNSLRRAAADDDGDGYGDVDGGCKRGGPTCKGYTNSTMSDIYDVAAAVSDSSSSVHSTAAVGIRALQLQPFDVSYASAHPLFKPSGEMTTAGVEFPFTAAQWKELERQAMIYKYMVASLPVPSYLLYSAFPTSLSASATFAPTSYLLGKYGTGMNFRWVGNSKDAEPGRCRRTDGKKWRCSRDVAPNQKYCERHMHRGRPRSRKPVELLHHHHSLSDFPIKSNSSRNNSIKNTPAKKTRLNGSNLPSVGVESSSPSVPPSNASTFAHLMTPVTPFVDSRSLAWTEEQQWQQLVQTSINSQTFQHQFEGEPLNLNPHVGFNTKSDMSLLERPLIDAWSMEVTGSKDNCGSKKTSISTSNVGHGDAMDEDLCRIHMSLGVIDPWVGFPTSPGGPLAEVLRPGSVAATTTGSTSNPATPEAGEGDLITPPATAVSSPSGVLQKTLASFSDSSGSSSPTCHNSKAKPDMPFHWLN